MLPSVFGENLFDDSLSDFFGFGRMMPQISSELYGKHAKNLMKTDVRELDGSYELDVDLPGFKKDEVTVDLQDGYLTISAAKALDKDESDQKGKFLRQERYAHSTNPNQFCLEIILCRIRGAFDYLIYPYYPAYMG